MPEVACGGGGLFSGCRLMSWVYSAVLFPSVQLEIMDHFFSSHTDWCQMSFSAFEDQLSLNQVDFGVFVEILGPFGSSGLGRRRCPGCFCGHCGFQRASGFYQDE